MKNRIIVIGASLNGISALSELVSGLPKDFPAPILVTQHVAAHSPGMLPHILGNAGPLPATHPKDREILQPGHIYVAPPDRHMLVAGDQIRLSHGPKENLSRPAIDPLFRSAALSYGPAAVGIVLTGQLDDGTAGLLAIKDRGGVAIVQEPLEASAPSMPKSALRHVVVDHRCRVLDMARLLVTLANDAPGPEPSAESNLLEIENRIALAVSTVDDWWELARLSKPSGLGCPECHSSLFEMPDQRILRLRCRSGHGFSAESLMSGQEDDREKLLASLYGALLEEATIAARLVIMTGQTDDLVRANYLAERSARLRNEADQIGAWMRATTGLVEPEPEYPGPAREAVAK